MTVSVPDGKTVAYASSSTTLPTGTNITAGYVLSGWTVDGVAVTDPLNMEITKDTTFVAVFTIGQFDVTVTGGATGIPGTATGLEDFTFTPVVTDKTITAVTYTVGTGEAVTIYPDANGMYTVPSTAVTGDITIAVTSVASYGTLTFIYDSQYKALTSDTKIAVLTPDTASNDYLYKIDTVTMYWSSEYSAYLLIVKSSVTEAQVMAAMTQAEGTSTAITYSADVNSDEKTNVTDAGRINAFLHDLAGTTATFTGSDAGTGANNFVVASQQLERLKADVNANETVSVLDINDVITAIQSAT